MKEILILLGLTTILLSSCDTGQSSVGDMWLTHEDVYLNLKKQGFETEKMGDDVLGVSWQCKMTHDNFSYNVSTYGENENTISSVKTSVFVKPPNNAYEASSFYEMIATIPYKENDYGISKQWILSNLSNDGADTIIGNGKWSIKNPTKWNVVITLEES